MILIKLSHHNQQRNLLISSSNFSISILIFLQICCLLLICFSHNINIPAFTKPASMDFYLISSSKNEFPIISISPLPNFTFNKGSSKNPYLLVLKIELYPFPFTVDFSKQNVESINGSIACAYTSLISKQASLQSFAAMLVLQTQISSFFITLFPCNRYLWSRS